MRIKVTRRFASNAANIEPFGSISVALLQDLAAYRIEVEVKAWVCEVIVRERRY